MIVDYRNTYFIMDPEHRVDRVVAKNLNERRALQTFGEGVSIHRYEVKSGPVVEAEVERGLYARVLGSIVEHPIQMK